MGWWKDYRIFQKKKCYICVTFSLHFCNVNVTLLIQGEGTVPKNAIQGEGTVPKNATKKLNYSYYEVRAIVFQIPTMVPLK